MAWDPTSRVKEISDRLVRWASETGTPGEAAFGARLADLLGGIPYFRDNPHHIVLVDSHGEPKRKSVVAIVKGQGRRALAMAGHYDVVAVDNYRDLASLAFRPDDLLSALLDDLRSRPLSAGEARALADFESGDFVPGRGMLDMKSGLAAGIAVLEEFAANPDRQGNLVFMATPDEERNSRGMRSLRNALAGIAAGFDVEIEAGINLDSTSDQGDGEEGRAIYRGTIGKSLPFAVVIGRSSHASYPFEGVSAQLIAAEISRAIEANPALCDRTSGEVSPPPICLECKDLRGGYEVTTPERVWVAFNWLSHAWSPRDILDRFTAAIGLAMDRAVASFNERADAYADMLATPQSPLVQKGRIVTVAELKTQVREIGGAAALARIAKLEADMKDCDDPLALTRAVVEAMVREAGMTGPTVIVGLSSLVYPAAHLGPPGSHSRFAEAIEEARRSVEAMGNASIKYREYFTGISDMSFFGHRPDAADGAFIAANTPASALIDGVGADVLSFPVVNIGPWGREYHQRLERVYAPFAFRELPQFLKAIVTRYFG